MVELQQTAELLPAFDRVRLRPRCRIRPREEQHVVLALMIAFLSVMRDEFGQRLARAIFAKEDEPRSAF